ncbi:MAG: substrate-binding domain-containing protein [Gemmatimonadota bacterium]|nr:MAG: substrate-binding domain-containing protein [Gemmatimonadota bacterium]
MLTLGIPTTVQDSGLLDLLLPEFERAHPEFRVRFIAAGSGELLALGARGDLDVLLSHSPAAEIEFVEAGHGRSRQTVMENDFVIAGPPSDPAGIRPVHDAALALVHIAEAGTPFLSRGDDSGTHRKELDLRAEAGLSAGGAGYREAGQGMGAVLRAASDLGAYALCDRATFLNLSETLELEILVEGDPRLLNVYSVVEVARARQPEGARAFAEWMRSAAGRRAIASYGSERLGVPLFRPTG